MSKINIFYTEDDETLAFLTQDNLLQYGFSVFHFTDGLIALENFKKQHFDICILDIMMPNLDGFDLAKAIREVDKNIPILFLSAKTLKEDKLKGLRLGADDYLVKPFSIEELILKIEIFLKRKIVISDTKSNQIVVGNFEFDVANFTLISKSDKVQLTQRESQLLYFFIENKNQILKRETILKAIWGDDDYFMGRSLDVFVSRLRKIFKNNDQILIENIHGVGFRFSEK